MSPLQGYISTALTNADARARLAIDATVSAIRAAAGDALDVYFPGDFTDPVRDAHVSPEDVFRIDRERVKGADVIFLLAHTPSIGVGQELTMALESLTPIVLIAPRGTRVSRMALGVPTDLIDVRYDGDEDLRAQLRAVIAALRPRLEERRTALAALDANVTGAKIRAQREQRQLTRAELASRIGLTEVGVAHLEEASDRQGDPSLTQLRRIAAVLGVRAADLV